MRGAEHRLKFHKQALAESGNAEKYRLTSDNPAGVALTELRALLFFG
jgi:hypothetical protein